MAIVYQYSDFISLVLHDVHNNCPIFPFDPSTGMNGNVGYHYSPDISIKEMPGELGFVISHYQDNDSRRICCLQADESVITNFPDILSDAVTQGLSAWGGRIRTAEQILVLAKQLQPAREESYDENDPDNPGQLIHYTKTYGEIYLDDDGILNRSVVITTD